MASVDTQLRVIQSVRAWRNRAPPTFREFCEDPEFCGLSLSPLIAAIADASEGHRITTVDDATAKVHFGCNRADMPSEAPRTVVVRAGGRGGKTSRLLAPKALHALWTVQAPTLGKGEAIYSLLVAPDLSLAHQTLSFVRGYVDGSPTLRAALVGEPTSDEITLRRPDGRLGVVRVVAASRGGRGMRGKTLAYFGMDEACFFMDAGSVVNDNEIYRAGTQRLVPGAQGWIVSTPWIALIGLLEELLSKNFGSHRQALCCIAPTRALNPGWDPDGTISQDLLENDPDNYTREILAEPLSAGSGVFFDRAAIDASMLEERALQLAPLPGGTYGAGGDFAFRRDSSAQAIVQLLDVLYHLAALEEQRPTGGVALKPSAVVSDFAAVLQRYGVGEIGCDSHERDVVAEAFGTHGVSVVALPEGQTGKVQQYTFTRTLFREGRVRLPNDPRLKRQLQAVTARPMPGGGLSITSPRQAGGGHGDLVSALVGALWQAQFAQASNSTMPRARGPRPRM